MRKYLVVGSGLAGSILSYELLKAGVNVTLITNPNLPSSSQVAGGLINPVTGKFLGKTWLVDELFTVLNAYYPELEKVFQTKFYHKTGLFRPFTSEEHKKSSLAQIEKHELHDFIQVVEDTSKYENFFHCDLGGMWSPGAGWMDMPKFLNEIHVFLQSKITWIEEEFDHSSLDFEKGIYKNTSFEKIVFCEGFYVKNNPFFNWLPMNPVKGETILGEIEEYTVPSIVNQGKWLIPLNGNKVRLGATYSWHELDFETTQKAKDDLMQVAQKILKKPIKVSGQQAGVRPATKDRRPILGKHPEHDLLYVFNGLGTKGVSLAPFFAKQLVANMLREEVIHSEANIERFLSLYS